MAAVTVIKLTGENHSDIDLVASQIKMICDADGIKLRGPIPLPTRRLVVPVRKAPDGEGSETYTIGKCEFISDSWKWTSHRIKMKQHSDVLPEFQSLTQ